MLLYVLSLGKVVNLEGKMTSGSQDEKRKRKIHTGKGRLIGRRERFYGHSRISDFRRRFAVKNEGEGSEGKERRHKRSVKSSGRREKA